MAGVRPALLLLAQRIPYPANKGEKIRLLHILRHLAVTHDVHLGTLVDDPDDMQHIQAVRALCASAHFAVLDRKRARVTCLRGLLTGEALSVTFYNDAGLAAWVRETIARVHPGTIVISSSNMAPYVLDLPGAAARCVVDLVDVDSEKWRAYAETDRGPMRWVNRREWHRVRALEGRIARECRWCTFVSVPEAALFQSQHPEAAPRIRAISNGVDHVYFDPAALDQAGAKAAPYDTGRPTYVFTGTMDYPPNIDAVTWFATAILPRIQVAQPRAQFVIVGANPAPSVCALARDGVIVTGRVADVRPYTAHATAAVAPMRIARGIQNKVLEAMAMARPVVLTSDALEGIDATPGTEILLADTEDGFAAACLGAGKAGEVGLAARRRVVAHYSWPAQLQALDGLIAA